MSGRLRCGLILAFTAGLCTAVSPSMATTLLGPTPYLSAADSPFGATVAIENFEDGLLNLAGLSASAGSVGSPGSLTDSVDLDDSNLDGFGNAGRSWYSGGNNSVLTFTFNAAQLGGQLPTQAGLVWTDVGQVTSGDLGFGQVTFEAFGPGNVSLGVIGPVTLGDGSAAGGTAEDRFFGVVDAGGIAAIRLSMSNSTDWEVDHVQYGFIPEPGTLTLALAGAAMLLRRRS